MAKRQRETLNAFLERSRRNDAAGTSWQVIESDAKPMLGERLDRNHISQHGLHTVSTMPTLFAGAVGEAVNVFDREH